MENDEKKHEPVVWNSFKAQNTNLVSFNTSTVPAGLAEF